MTHHLDRLVGWSRVRIDCDDAALIDRLASTLPHDSSDVGSTPNGPPRTPLPLDLVIECVAPGHRPRYRVDHAGTSVMVDGRGAVATYLASLVTRHRLDAEPHAVHIHAALVGTERNAMLVGPSGAGKSTLAAHLVQRGWRYGSDEMTTLSARAAPPGSFTSGADVPREVAVAPHAKAISLKGAARDLLGSRVAAAIADIDEGSHRWEVPLDAFGAASWTRQADSASADLRVSAGVDLVAAIEYRPGPAASVDLTPAEVLSVLVTNAMDIRRHGVPGLAMLARVAGSAVGVGVAYGALDDAETLLSKALRRRESADTSAAHTSAGSRGDTGNRRAGEAVIEPLDTPAGHPDAVLVRFVSAREPTSFLYSPSSFRFAVLTSSGAEHSTRALSTENLGADGDPPPPALVESLRRMGFWVSDAPRADR